MGEDKNKKPILGSIFVSNEESFDYKSRQEFFLQKEWEYEKRSVSSLLIGSGGGVSLLLGYLSTGADNFSKFAILGLIFSVGFFIFALLLTAVCQFVLNALAANQYEYFTLKNNHQNYISSINDLDNRSRLFQLMSMFFDIIEIDQDATSDTRFKLTQKMYKSRHEYLRIGKLSDRLQLVSSRMLMLACVSFALGVILSVSMFILETI